MDTQQTQIKEEWRPVVGYEGTYEVSNLGMVARLPSRQNRKRHVMVHFLINSGYLAVRLTKNKKTKTKLIHRLVADAFIPNPQNLRYVNHKDENPLNNFVENLEHCTCGYNNSYGNWAKRQSESHINNLESNKLAKKVVCIETGAVYLSIRDAERKTGCHHSYISQSCRDSQKTCHGFHWKYISK